MLLTSVLFETDSACVFKIPPGEVSLKHWNSKSVVWRGALRLVEEEQTSVTTEDAPFLGLRLKLELLNSKPNLLAHANSLALRSLWAEVWFNPFLDTDMEYKIGNDGSETLTMTPESTKYYRILTQLPDSGYFPVQLKENGPLIQIALGLAFPDLSAASAFSESIATYKRHFRNFQEKFVYDQHLSEIQSRIGSLQFPATSYEGPESSDDDDFGNFVGASYD